MSTRLRRVVIVGASLAGVRSAEALRREGFDGDVVLVGAEGHFPPYDRPPLSKGVLLGGELDDVRLRVLPGLDVDLVLSQRAADLSLSSREVVLESGDRLRFDGLVIATGATPRQPRSLSGDPAKVFVLRTVEDSLRLKAALSGRPRVAVVGGGFIGCEVAASCRELGLDVTVIEGASSPMEPVLGPDMARELATMHRDHGTILKVNSTVTSVHDDHVLLEDGSTVNADVVVVAVGAAPEVSWLAGSGLDVSNGVLLDQYCFAVGADGVVAAGDVARWFNPLFGVAMRVEHWSNAVEQADTAVHNLVAAEGAAVPFESVPYFWSDQYGNKIQFVGRPLGDVQVIEGSPADRRFVAAYTADGRLMGALCVNRPSWLGRYRRMVAGRTSADAVLDAVEASG